MEIARVHESDKPWMTGYTLKLKSNSDNGHAYSLIIQLIDYQKEKLDIIRLRQRIYDCTKWYKTINALIGANNDTNPMIHVPEIEIKETAENCNLCSQKIPGQIRETKLNWILIN